MFVPYSLRDFLYEMQNKSKKYTRESVLSDHYTSRRMYSGGLEGFQAIIHPEECIGRIYSARDVQAFHMMLIVRCREP